ncbi:hypothetical protein IG197_34755 (plasmid) [Aminobacter sp. SR38]|jgi:hypothetical protein|uniref:hypothetical protein n=1 Tax=Aminobacter sp. SR38 TaxID=2774562 RepID=UPI00177BF071|nr:hypothetical protein [Aminobacter sp. SR38]QOF75530.1 hypothetical protein IG197_34755 [Aminobacter sp. SR38]
MTKKLQSAEVLDDVLATLHEMLEDDATREDVLRFAALNPAFRGDILAFVAEWVASEGSDLGDEDPTGERTARNHHSILERFWAPVQSQASDPFDAMDSDDIDRIAANCRIDTGILRKLCRCLIDVGTIPGQLLVWLADELRSSPSALHAFLDGVPAAAGADYFAPQGRTAPGKVSFEAAVKSSTLDLSQKRFWFPDMAA